MQIHLGIGMPKVIKIEHGLAKLLQNYTALFLPHSVNVWHNNLVRFNITVGGLCGINGKWQENFVILVKTQRGNVYF